MPLNVSLDIAASRMLHAIEHNTSSKDRRIGEFFDLANKKSLQGPALVSYYSQLKKIGKSMTIAEKAGLAEDIFLRSQKSERLKKSSDTFVSELQKKYPKSLYDRISLASHGCVVSDNVKPQSSWKKFLVSLSKFVREA